MGGGREDGRKGGCVCEGERERGRERQREANLQKHCHGPPLTIDTIYFLTDSQKKLCSGRTVLRVEIEFAQQPMALTFVRLVADLEKIQSWCFG